MTADASAAGLTPENVLVGASDVERDHRLLRRARHGGGPPEHGVGTEITAAAASASTAAVEEVRARHPRGRPAAACCVDRPPRSRRSIAATSSVAATPSTYYTNDIHESVDDRRKRHRAPRSALIADYTFGPVQLTQAQAVGPDGVDVVFVGIDHRLPSVLDADSSTVCTPRSTASSRASTTSPRRQLSGPRSPASS